MQQEIINDIVIRSWFAAPGKHRGLIIDQMFVNKKRFWYPGSMTNRLITRCARVPTALELHPTLAPVIAM